MDTNGGSATRPPSRQLDYTCTQLQGALMHLASIDPIELCNEAKIEHCRATRDLRSCRRYVHSVLTSCGHASLCEECSQRCDVCPICRVPLPKEGTRLRLRLYYECIGAGLISKRCDDRFQDEEESEKHLVPDVQRLYSLFDVALENNLSSLICHYISDVCMDESAVSSDPVSAFLLDEVVVKDWCKQTFRSILSDIQVIYNLSVEEMFRNLDSLLKFSSKLASITNILEVLESSFKDSHAAILHDVHCLQENISKSKQHMEIMAWSIRHNFLEDVASQHENIFTWRSVVHERNSAAVSRVWPDSNSSAQQTSTLFIEDALSNLEVEQEVADIQGEEYHIEFLQKEGNSSYYPSGISVMAGCYPFENLRAATDILFLRGSPDLVVAKQAIFLYYLFDRHWTRPEEDWRHIIDDFAATFSISRHLLLESFIFYLLDDCNSVALQEACRILPEISGPTIHPKVAQVLLERQNPYAALMVMRWSGRDGAELGSLGEAITAVRVRIECGFLTEAFMYQRTACMKLKERMLNDKSSQKGNGDLKDDRRSWSVWVEALVLEICYLCIRRNLVEQMIDLPWNKDEEKYIHRCLLDFVMEDPSTAYGSLLVVYYLQRYRYIDAYQVDQKLQNVEQDFIAKGSAKGEILSKMRSTSQWRAGLIGKSIDLLPDVLQQKLKAGTLSDEVASPVNEVSAHATFEVSMEEEKISTGFAAPRPHGSSILLGVDNTTTSLKRPLPETPLKMNGSLNNNIKMTFGVSSPLTTLFSDADKGLRPKSSFTKSFNFDTATPPSHAVGYPSPSPSPLRNINGSSTRAQSNRFVPSYQVNEKTPETSLSGFASKFRATSHGNNQGRFTGLAQGNHPSTPVELAQSKMADRSPSPNDMMEFSWSNGNRFQPEDVNGGARWRSDGVSDDEEYQTPVTSQGKLARATRRSRRLRG